LTVQETAERLGMEPAMVKSQFLKLRQLAILRQLIGQFNLPNTKRNVWVECHV
jgi:hypothetical protein